MKHNYQNLKSILTDIANWAKNEFNDKPAIRQIINHNADLICKEYNLSEYHCNLLHNYASKLHPKN